MTEAEWLVSDDPHAMLRLLIGNDANAAEGLGGRAIATDRKLRLFAVALSRLVHPHGYWEGVNRRSEEAAVYAYAEALADGDRVVKGPDHAPYCEGLNWLVRGTGSEAANSHLYCLPGVHRPAAALLRDLVGNPWRPVKPLWDWVPNKPKTTNIPVPTEWAPWLWNDREDRILSLARAAYEERGRACEPCEGTGHLLVRTRLGKCPDCRGTGRVEDGTLDPVRLMVLADALEEAGCDSEELLRHLRGQERCWLCVKVNAQPGDACSVCGQLGAVGPFGKPCATGWVALRSPHARGCWALDLILGKE